MEILLRKTEVIWIWRWRYYEEILENFFEVISVKSKKTTKNFNKNYEKNIRNTLQKLLKIILTEILWNFQGDFWKNSQRITETSDNFIEKLHRNHKEILEIFGALSKICLGRFEA